MWPFEKPLEEITASDLSEFAANLPPEDRFIEYKSSTYTTSSARDELAGDVSAFANEAGGCLIIGIDEATGVLVGCGRSNADEEKIRLQNMLAMGVNPRIPNVAVRHVSVGEGEHVLIFQIPRSWIGPHQVVGTKKIFRRISGAKQEMDVDQLRRAFRGGPDLAERVRAFRHERIGLILADETPVPMPAGPKLIVHIVSADQFADDRPVDLGPVLSPSGPLLKAFPGVPSNAPQFNLDGVLCHQSAVVDANSRGYVQVMRNGMVEYVISCHPYEAPPQRRTKSLFAPRLHDGIIAAVNTTLALAKIAATSAPYHVIVTVSGARGYALQAYDYTVRGVGVIDRDVALLPPIILQDGDISPEELAQPVIDLMWNMVGLPKEPKAPG